MDRRGDPGAGEDRVETGAGAGVNRYIGAQFAALAGEDDAGVGSAHKILVDGAAKITLGMPSERIADV